MIGEAAAIEAVWRRGAPPDHPPPLTSGRLALISKGKPPVWFSTIRMVSTFFALLRVLTLSFSATNTHNSLNSGRYFETGSSSEMRPSSTSLAIVTPQNPFVCEHCINTLSIPIGRFSDTLA